MVEVSVIVPIYGVEKYIERSLNSLFTQTKTLGVEFILVNDCTKDNSIEIAKRVISNYTHLDVRIVEHEVNRGLAAARQTGMDVARGEYVLHIDSDDWCETDMIEQMYERAKGDDADVVISDFLIDYPHRTTYSIQKCPPTGEECVNDILRGKLYGSVWNKMIRRSIFVDNNLNWVEGISLWEDLLITTKVFCYVNRVSYLPKAFVHYFQNAESICGVASPSKLNDVVNVIASLEQFFADRGVVEKYYRSLEYKKLHAKYFLMCYSRGEQRKEFARMFKDSNWLILRMGCMTLDRRLALKFASNGHLWAFDKITQTRNILRVLRNGLN